MFGSIKSFINSKLTPSQKDFQTKGILSPQQFMQAGDQLTNFGWKWQKSLNKYTNKYLPDPNKQYLIANATSMFRIKQLTQQQIIQSTTTSNNNNTNNKSTNQYGFTQISGDQILEEKQQNFRNYQIYITYDEYYHTPRLWIKGNNIDGLPLTSNNIFEDIYSEYHNQTVTQQTMPYLQCRMLTIHPCKHSDVMKKFIDQSKTKGKTIKSYQSLVIFLKFMSSIMPTIRYDQTFDIEI